MTISELLFKKIQYLCSKINSVEWSGVLFWKYEGQLENLSSFKIEGVDIFPMQKGTQAYTEFTFDEKVFDYQMNNDLMECKYGLIHSHNNMATFFSGTDNEELQENAPNHNCYLSLIVNNRMEMCARLAIQGTIESTNRVFNFTNPDGDAFSVQQESNKKEVIFYHDCDILKPISFIDEEDFIKRVTSICEVKPIPVSVTKTFTAGDSDIVEKFLVTYFGGTKKDTLDDILASLKSTSKCSIYHLLGEAKKNRSFKIKTNEDEVEFLEEVLDTLNPYEYDNLEDLKNKLTTYISNTGTPQKSFNFPSYNGYYGGY